jgi:hypothetical protein
MAERTNIRIAAGNSYPNSNGSYYHCILTGKDYGLFQEVRSDGHTKFVVTWLPTIYRHEDDSLTLGWQQGHYFEDLSDDGDQMPAQLLAAAMKDFNEREKRR